MSIFDFEVSTEETPKKDTGTPWDIKLLVAMYKSGDLSPKQAAPTLTALHLQGHTGMTESVITKLRQLLTRVEEPNPSALESQVQLLYRILTTAGEECRDVDKQLTAKINQLMGDKSKISMSALKTTEFLIRLGYCTNL